MYLSGEKLPPQVKSIVEDCGYTSIIDELAYQAKSMFNIPKWPLVPAVALTATFKAGYNVFDASAIDALHKNTRPIYSFMAVKTPLSRPRWFIKTIVRPQNRKKLCGSLKAQHMPVVFRIIRRHIQSAWLAGSTLIGNRCMSA